MRDVLLKGIIEGFEEIFGCNDSALVKADMGKL